MPPGEKALIKLSWLVLKLEREEAPGRLHLLLDAHQLEESKGSE